MLAQLQVATSLYMIVHRRVTLYIYILYIVNGVAAPKHTGSFLSNLQASPASPIWFLPNEEEGEKDHPVILKDVDPVKLTQQSRIAKQHWFCYGAKVSAQRVLTSALPLAFEPSAQQSQERHLKVSGQSKVGFTSGFHTPLKLLLL
jgi:hypothetical protein